MSWRLWLLVTSLSSPEQEATRYGNTCFKSLNLYEKKLNHLASPFNCETYPISRTSNQFKVAKITFEGNYHFYLFIIAILFLILSSFIIHFISLCDKFADSVTNISNNVANLSYINDNSTFNSLLPDDSIDPIYLLKKLKSSNLNRLIVGQLNINKINLRLSN